MSKQRKMHSPFDLTVIDEIKNRLIERKETLAVAESVTSGLAQVAFALAADATQFFQGGLTAYNLGQKSRQLHIEPIHALSCNCVSDRVAGEMAISVSQRFNSDWGIGITGYSTAVPESGNRMFAHYAISYKSKLVVSDCLDAQSGESYDVQVRYVSAMLSALLSAIEKRH